MFDIPRIDKAFIIDNSSYSSYIKGLDYYNRGFVRSVSLAGNNHLEAKVEGTRTYSVSVEFAGGGINAECDCPYELDDYCKHVAAVLIYAMENVEKIRAGARPAPPAKKGGEPKAMSKTVASLIASDRLGAVVEGFFEKYPELADKFLLYCDYAGSAGKRGKGVTRRYSKSVEEYREAIAKDFIESGAHRTEEYAKGRRAAVASQRIEVFNYGGSEYSRHFEKAVDALFEKYYSRASELRVIGDLTEAAKVLFAVREFSNGFGAAFRERLDKMEKKAARILAGCVRYHASRATAALVGVAGSANFSKEDGEWFYNHLLTIYFSSNFGEASRREKFEKLKFLSGRHGAIEHMHNFIMENLANNYNPMTGDIFYITPENAHECFYLLNIAGESGRAIKVAEKYRQKNVLLQAEYIEFLQKHMEYEKAAKFAYEVVTLAAQNPESLRRSPDHGEYQELRGALSVAVAAIDSMTAMSINSSQGSSKKSMIPALEGLYAALCLELFKNENLAVVDRIVNVIETCERHASGRTRAKYMGEPISLEGFADMAANEPGLDDFFLAKVFKAISRDDLVIKTAKRTADDYAFSRISSLIAESRPAETFEMFRGRIDKSFTDKSAKSSPTKASRLLAAMLRIPGMDAEYREYMRELQFKFGFRRKMTGDGSGVEREAPQARGRAASGMSGEAGR